MATLIDTSAWIELYRRGSSPAALRLKELAQEGNAVLCGPVEAELIRGARDSEVDALLEDFSHFPHLDTQRVDFLKSGDLMREAAARGGGLSPFDSVIAALCLRHKLNLLTLDSGFKRVPGLQLEKF